MHINAIMKSILLLSSTDKVQQYKSYKHNTFLHLQLYVLV